MSKRRLSGIKPTGKLHLGNYFGALQQFINKQNSNDFYFIADYHALTTLPQKDILLKNSLDIVMDYIALGLDVNKSTIFLQSSIPEHCELAWILSNATPMGLLNRAHAYKDRKDKESVNAGIFLYPVLMAADILIYDSELVPVGKDQIQHVEIARDIALKFNRHYGDTFTLPKAEIVEDLKTIKGTDGKKMSKSYNNTIEIFGEEKSLKKQIMSIVSDSKGIEEEKNPDECNIFNIYKLFLNKEEEADLRNRYLSGGLGYGHIKKELFERVRDFLQPFKEKRSDLSNNMDYVTKVLKDGKNKAREIARKKIDDVRDKVGLIKL